MSAQPAWTAETIRQYGARMPTVDAIMAVTGYRRAKAYDLLASGEALPFPVIRIGRRCITPTRAVLELLQLDTPDTNGAGAPPPATATIPAVPAATGDHSDPIVRPFRRAG